MTEALLNLEFEVVFQDLHSTYSHGIPEISIQSRKHFSTILNDFYEISQLPLKKRFIKKAIDKKARTIN